MATNSSSDQELIDQALAPSGERTNRATVTRLLEQFVARRRQRHLAALSRLQSWARA
jgi:hypothetical protein